MASKAKAIAAKGAKSKAAARKYKMYINGEFVEAHSRGVFPVYNPSTEEIIAEVPEADEKDVDRAVAAAKAAFDSGAWPQTTAQDRGRILFRLAERIRKEAAHLADLECRNSGKPIVEAEYDIADAATCFEYYGGMATKVLGHVNPVPDNALSLSLREPIGIAAQIIPWNYPLLMAAWKLAPALAAGNTVVLKPAEQTPLSILVWAELIADILPPGVLNIVNGFGLEAGKPLASSSRLADPLTSPTATMRSPSMAMSPLNAGAPVPSTMVPLRMIRSNTSLSQMRFE